MIFFRHYQYVNNVCLTSANTYKLNTVSFSYKTFKLNLYLPDGINDGTTDVTIGTFFR